MKKYLKPELNNSLVTNRENISSLADWLEHVDNEYANAGITTYELNS